MSGQTQTVHICTKYQLWESSIVSLWVDVSQYYWVSKWFSQILVTNQDLELVSAADRSAPVSHSGLRNYKPTGLGSLSVVLTLIGHASGWLSGKTQMQFCTQEIFVVNILIFNVVHTFACPLSTTCLSPVLHSLFFWGGRFCPS